MEHVARALRPGGLYVLGLHLTPTTAAPSEDEAWSAQRGHLCVTSSLRLLDRDLEQRVERYATTYDVYTPTKHEQLHDVVAFRTYTLPQMTKLIRSVEAFSVAATFDFAYDLKHPITPDDATEDIVYVLQKIG